MGFMSSSVGTSSSYTVSSTDVYAFWHAPKGHPKASRRFTSWWDSYFSVALNALHASCHTAVESHSALTPLSAAHWNVSNEEAWKQLLNCCTADDTSPAELGCPDLSLALLYLPYGHSSSSIHTSGCYAMCLGGGLTGAPQCEQCLAHAPPPLQSPRALQELWKPCPLAS